MTTTATTRVSLMRSQRCSSLLVFLFLLVLLLLVLQISSCDLHAELAHTYALIHTCTHWLLCTLGPCAARSNESGCGQLRTLAHGVQRRRLLRMAKFVLLLAYHQHNRLSSLDLSTALDSLTHIHTHTHTHTHARAHTHAHKHTHTLSLWQG